MNRPSGNPAGGARVTAAADIAAIREALHWPFTAERENAALAALARVEAALAEAQRELAEKKGELAVAYGSGRTEVETEWFSALDRAKERAERAEAALKQAEQDRDDSARREGELDRENEELETRVASLEQAGDALRDNILTLCDEFCDDEDVHDSTDAGWMETAAALSTWSRARAAEPRRRRA